MADKLLAEKEIFNTARQIAAPEERQVYLQQACGDDPAAMHRVLELLRIYDQERSFLEQPPAAFGPTIDEPIAERPGSVIGPYKLLEQIGEGGFGVVFMAEQIQPVRRRVALKVLKPGMDTRQVIARFEAERQALAIMDHPNIAKVHDGGATASGRPYFVMELVKGVPITDFCDQNHLTPRQRLELFLPVCQAVQHAHQKGIIHRDLKPSNVLVTVHDTTPVVKVIDFGVAKALGQELTDKTLFTGFAQMIGTPLYMSPEQAGQSGLDIDTRSDIYSLGVLLYELLTGTTPFTKERFKEAAYDEIRRIIREEEPPRPSTRLSDSKDSLPSISAQRQTDPSKLTKLVRGELDWIVMKALEKDRNRRYETANGFAQDVQRYLADEPVQACPPSAWYRFRKFARRNRGRLTVAMTLLAVVGVTAASIGWAARERETRLARITGQVETILDEAARLEREQKWPEAGAAVERAETVIAGGEVGDAIQQRLADARRDLAFVAELDRIRQERAATVEGKFNDAGAVNQYADAFRGYGLNVEVLAAEEAVARLEGKPALAVAIAAALDDWVEGQRNLGARESSWKPLVAVARALDHDPLRDRLRAVWGQPLTPELRVDMQRLAESIDVKAQRPGTLCVLARTLKRAQLADAALRILRSGQQAHWADFWLNFELAYQLNARRDYAGALRYYSAAVSLRSDSAAAHNNLGVALHKHGRRDEAVTEYRRAMALDPKNAIAHVNVGNALSEQGKDKEAIACYRKAIAIDAKYAYAHARLGDSLRGQGKLDEAIICYHKAIELEPNYSSAHYTLGNALRDQNKLDQAIASYRKAIDINPKQSGAHNNLGRALLDQGKQNKAIACFRNAIAADPRNAIAHFNLGLVLRQQGKHAEAITCFHDAINADLRHAGAEDLGITLSEQGRALIHYQLGIALREQGKWEEAIAEYQKAIRAGSKDAAAHYELGFALGQHRRDYEGATAAFRKAIQLEPKYVAAHYELGMALTNQGKLDAAISPFQQAIALDPKHTTAHFRLANACARMGRWHQALTPMDKAAQLDPKDHWRPYQAAALHLHTGDRAGYRRICRNMLEQFGNTENLWLAEHVAMTCLLVPDAVAERGRVLKLADRLVTKTTNERWFLLCKALAEYRAGRHAQAVQWLERFVPNPGSLWPYEVSGFAVLALAKHHQGGHQDALAALDQAEGMVAASVPDTVGGRLFNDDWQDWLHALTLLDEAEKVILPDKVRLHFYRGSRRGAHGKWPEAEAEYRQAIALDPKHVAARYQLGMALTNQGKLGAALPFFRQTIALDPKHADAHYHLANVCARLGRWDEAVAPMDKAVELTRNDHWRLYLAAGLHLHTGDLAGYRRICLELLERFGDTQDLQCVVATAITCLLLPDTVADRDRVLKLADRPVTKDANNRWFQLCKALAEYRVARDAESIQWLERFAPNAAAGWPSEVSAFAVLALAQHHQGRHEDALAALDQAEKLIAAKLPDPAAGRPFAWDWINWLHGQTLLREAEKTIKPDEARVHFYRGNRRGGHGKWSDAEAEYRKAIRLRPDWYAAHFELAVAIWEQGRQKDAQAAFRDALRFKPKPLDGPPHATLQTSWSQLENWVVKDQELHQLDDKRWSQLLFGDPTWTDYDFEAEVEIISGGSEVGLIFRATARSNFLYAIVGGFGNTRHGVLGRSPGGAGSHGMVAGQSKKGCWYRLRIEARGERAKMFLDGKLLVTVSAGERRRGCVGLLTSPAHVRFRNVKVTDATGTVLWEGVQNILPKQ
jgi:tetratricopeptide (TPR) repeat protein